GYYLSSGWLHAKLTLVTLLIIYHFYCGHLLKIFRDDNNQRSHVFYRWFSEVPVFLLIAIVILAIVNPFQCVRKRELYDRFYYPIRSFICRRPETDSPWRELAGPCF